MKTLTTKELIKVLSEFPDDAVVWTEGCDCHGEAGFAVFDPVANEVTIARTDGEMSTRVEEWRHDSKGELQ